MMASMEKKLKVDYEEGNGIRRWDELLPEALTTIFKMLSLKEVLTVVPSVCKSWSKVVTAPECWQEIDFMDWRSRPSHVVDRMLAQFISRSHGSVKEFSASQLFKHQILYFIGKLHGPCLQTLRLQGSYIDNSTMEFIFSKQTNITVLDLSFCDNISAVGLESVGKHCKLLTSFRYARHEVIFLDFRWSKETQENVDDLALVIATTMPTLRHLYITHWGISINSVFEILKNCKQLELLDLRGCKDFEWDREFIAQEYPGLQVLEPYESLEDRSILSPTFLQMKAEFENYDVYSWDRDMYSSDEEFYDSLND